MPPILQFSSSKQPLNNTDQKYNSIGYQSISEIDITASLDHLKGAYAENTLRAYQSDFNIFNQWCQQNNTSPLPCLPEDLVRFVDSEIKKRSPATIRRV